MWLILYIILLGMFSGWIAKLLVARDRADLSWGELFLAGIAGSFVGGIIGNLVSGQGFRIHPAGLIGTVLGAIVVLWIYVTAIKK
ncbi:MAG: GlsB/YeaQ/YmgE family stress response membrane protein [Acidimicrobiia bacterium]|nr:GlsB/YeaQ/YmgE family stress response membrane protein [Acidimicrobiia bacterium]